MKDGIVNYQIHKNVYDKLGRLVEQRNNNNKSGESLTQKKEFFEYDYANYLTLVKLIHDNHPVIYTQYYYDELGNTSRKYTGL